MCTGTYIIQLFSSDEKRLLMKISSNYKYFFFVQIALMCLFTLSISSCEKCDDPRNRDCGNYDPCIDILEPKALFGTGSKRDFSNSDYNNFYPDTTLYLDGDTIPAACNFYTYATDADSFYWKVGDDPRVFRGEEFFLDFEDVEPYVPILVEHIVLKKSSCFESFTVRDTIEKIIYPATVTPNSSSIYFNNTYRGSSTEFPGESIDVEFNSMSDLIINIPKGGNGINSKLYFRDLDEVYFAGGNIEQAWFGHAKFQSYDRKKVIITYKITYDFGETSQWYTYEGYRVE